MNNKINYILCLVAIISSLYIVVTKDNEIGLILKDLSIVITITIPYILEKIFKIKIDNKIKFVYIFFIFLAHFIGVILEVYNKIYCYDKIVHFLSGVLTSYLSLLILSVFNKDKNKLFNSIYMIIFTLAIAALWEMFEYTANIVFGGDAQKVILTGVNDTMQDIIVAFMGSILVSTLYIFNNKLALFNLKKVIER